MGFFHVKKIIIDHYIQAHAQRFPILSSLRFLITLAGLGPRLYLYAPFWIVHTLFSSIRLNNNRQKGPDRYAQDFH